MDTRKFHEKYFEHLKCNAEDVAKVIATDSNNEKWFQGEMAICFSSMPNYKIISSLEYNERETKPKDLDNWWGDHIEGTSFGIVTTEAQIYKKGPKKGYGKCDFILHTDDDFLATEIKVLWIYDDLDKDDIKKRFKDNNVYRDIRRLRNNLYKEYKKKAHVFVTLIIVSDGKIKNMLEEWVKTYLEKECKKIEIDKIPFQNVGYNNFSWERIDGEKHKYLKNIYLATLDLEHNF